MDTHHHGAAPGLDAPGLAHERVADLPTLGAKATHVLVTPTSEKAPDAAIVEGQVQTETQCLIFVQPADDSKRSATLRAHLELKGYSLCRTAASDGPVRFYVTRWGLVRELPYIAAVRAFAEQVGATDA